MSPEQTPAPFGQTIGQIISHLGRLMAVEVTMAKMDAKSAMTAAVMAVVFAFVAVLVLLVALLLLGMAVASGLIAAGLVPWAAQALAGLLFIALALFSNWIAIRRVRHAFGLPGRIWARLAADLQAVAQAATEGGQHETKPDE